LYIVGVQRRLDYAACFSFFKLFFVFISLLFVSTCKCYFVALVLLSLQITRKVNCKKNGEIGRLMGRIAETHDEVFSVNMMTVYAAEETIIY